MGFHRSFGVNAADATAQQWHIKNGKTAYLASGKVTGNAYTPAMMQFDGSSAFYRRAYTASGNKFTAEFLFTSGGTVGNTVDYMMCVHGGGSSTRKFVIAVVGDDRPNAEEENTVQFLVFNSSNTVICSLYSNVTVVDGAVRSVFCDFDGDVGTAVFQINGANADNLSAGTRVAPTTGTLRTGSLNVDVGGTDIFASNYHNGQIGYCGYREVAGLTPSDFFYSDGRPKPPTESGGWGGWGAQPLFWNEHGQMDNNLGSAGNMTRNGTIVVGKGGNT